AIALHHRVVISERITEFPKRSLQIMLFPSRSFLLGITRPGRARETTESSPGERDTSRCHLLHVRCAALSPHDAIQDQRVYYDAVPRQPDHLNPSATEPASMERDHNQPRTELRKARRPVRENNAWHSHSRESPASAQETFRASDPCD